MAKNSRETDQVKKLEPAFDTIAALVEGSRANVIRAANVALIDLYWSIGKYLSARCAHEKWGKSTVTGLAELIHVRRPDWRGFSAQNLWRMKQFFDLYSDSPKTLSAVERIAMVGKFAHPQQVQKRGGKTFLSAECSARALVGA